MKWAVSDVMTRTAVTVNAFAPLKDIVRRMQDYRVGAVPVLDQDDIRPGHRLRGRPILKEDADLEGEPRFFDGAAVVGVGDLGSRIWASLRASSGVVPVCRRVRSLQGSSSSTGRGPIAHPGQGPMQE